MNPVHIVLGNYFFDDLCNATRKRMLSIRRLSPNAKMRWQARTSVGEWKTSFISIC